MANTNTKSNTKAKSKQSNKNKKSRKKNKRGFGYTLKTVAKLLLLAVLLLILLFGILFYIKYGNTILTLQQEAKQLVKQSTLDTFRQTETSLVYDTNGKLLSVLKGEKDVYYIYYEDIPDYVTKAMIAIEDKKFYKHIGVDVKANIRAVLAYIKNKGEITQGGSTITQQLSRNVFLTHEVSWQRKAKEIFIALELEKKYEKYQILEFYLNNIYFANGYYGIQAASKGYFNKGINQLSLSQTAFLCAIPNNPTIYDPLTNMDNTLGRRDRILYQMLSDGMITKKEYNEAIKEKIVLNQKTRTKKNYIETFVYHSAVEALMKERDFTFRNRFEDEEDKENYIARYNELYNECQQSLYKSGYRIYTSIDTSKQKILQKSVNSVLKNYTTKNKEGIYELQGAAVCIDNDTGRVVAIVGGRSQNTTGYTLNRAFQSFRQPGSSIKPLIVYTPAFERGYYPDQIVVDEKIEDGPSNASGVYSGKMTLRKAVELSKNTVAYKIFEDIKPSIGLDYLLNMNFEKIVRRDYVPAVSLGGFTYGTSPLEMAAGYATIANDGYYRNPSCIVKIMDAKGEEIVKEEIGKVQIYDTNAARTMTDILVGVMKQGTARSLSLNNMVSAGKTGTSNNNKDGWFVGYTPYYTTSVWVGFDLPKSLNELKGATFPGLIWKNFMNEIHKGLPLREFIPFVDSNNPLKDEEDKQQEEMEEDNSEVDPEGIGELPEDEPIDFDTEDLEDIEDEMPPEDNTGDVGDENTEDVGDEDPGDDIEDTTDSEDDAQDMVEPTQEPTTDPIYDGEVPIYDGDIPSE